MKTINLAPDTVSMWSTVAVRDLETHEVDIYTIVPPDRANIGLNMISSLTPVAHALHGRRVGEIVNVAAPAGVIRLEICSIRQHQEPTEYG
jgi:transcription elongation GreA/GreB family factor